MAEDEKLIENSISRFGLRTLDVIRYDKPVNVSPWLKLVPGEGISLTMVARKIETELGIYHAVIVWNAREMVEFEQAPIKYGALWYIDKGERMSEAIEMASSLFKLRTGRYPTKCWVSELPKDAPDVFEVEGFENDPPKKAVQLRMASWVPERFVCAGIELIDAEILCKEGTYSVREVANGG